MRKDSIKKALLHGGCLFLALLAIDQITKYLAYRTLRVHGPKVLILNVFELHYLENRGAAFGMMRNMQWLFVVFALVITAITIWFYVRLPREQRFLPLRLVCIALASGAAGNMIDRVFHGYVIDFLYISLIDFPIFNVADIYVCVSTAVFLLLILFIYKEEDFHRIQGKKTKQEYLNDLMDKIQESRHADKE